MLKAVVTDLSTLDEDLRPLYEEKDGKHFLRVEPADGYSLDNTVGLKTALASERAAHAAAKTALKNFADLDPVQAKVALTQLADLGDLDVKAAREALEKVKKFEAFDPMKEADRLAEEKLEVSKRAIQARAKADKEALEAERDALKKKTEGYANQVERLLKQNTISNELDKLNPLDEARDVLKLLASNAIKLVDKDGEQVPVVVDDNGQIRTKIHPTDYSSVPFTVADYMAELREKKPVLFKAENTRNGMGTTASDRSASTKTVSGEYNPWLSSSRNITMQVLIEAKEPQRAARLKAEAGV